MVLNTLFRLDLSWQVGCIKAMWIFWHLQYKSWLPLKRRLRHLSCILAIFLTSCSEHSDCATLEARLELINALPCKYKNPILSLSRSSYKKIKIKYTSCMMNSVFSVVNSVLAVVLIK